MSSTELKTASAKIVHGSTVLKKANVDLNEVKEKFKIEQNEQELYEREKRKTEVMRQEIHDRDVQILVSKTSADAQIKTLVDEVASRAVSLGRHRTGTKYISALWREIHSEKTAVAEWIEQHEATCDQYDFCELAVLQQQKINSTLADEIADARYEDEVVQEVMQETTEEMEKEVISAQE
jgi:hypothetical protein